MGRPSPSGFVTGAANGHAAKVDQFEFPFGERKHLIGLLKALQHHLVHDSLLDSEPGSEVMDEKKMAATRVAAIDLCPSASSPSASA
jgi:hypothetical protein